MRTSFFVCFFSELFGFVEEQPFCVRCSSSTMTPEKIVTTPESGVVGLWYSWCGTAVEVDYVFLCLLEGLDVLFFPFLVLLDFVSAALVAAVGMDCNCLCLARFLVVARHLAMESTFSSIRAVLCITHTRICWDDASFCMCNAFTYSEFICFQSLSLVVCNNTIRTSVPFSRICWRWDRIFFSIWERNRSSYCVVADHQW